MRKFQINLSSGELYVLAGFLGYNFIFGVEEHTMQEWRFQLQKYIRLMVHRLEKKKLLLCEPGGAVYMHPDLMSVLQCMCVPDLVGMAAGNTGSGKYAETYVMQKADKTVLFRNLDDDNYKLTLSDNLTLSQILGSTLQNSQKSNMREQIPLDSVQSIQASLAAFHVDQAAADIQQYVTSPDAAKTILGILSGKNQFLLLQFQQKKELCYENVFFGCYVLWNDTLFKVHQKEPDIVTFHAMCQEELLREFSSSVLGKTIQIEEKL